LEPQLHGQPQTMRVLPFIALASAAFAQSKGPVATDPYTPISAGEKLKTHMGRIVAPSGLVKSAFAAGINQWENSPPEWGQGMKGYGRRYGHKLLNRAVENTIGFGVAATFRQDPRYFYSGQQGAWRRVKYAIAHTFVTRTDSGGRTISLWRFVGNYGAQFVSNTWRPDRESTTFNAMERGTISIGFDAAANIFKEFWPDIRRKLGR
jgi:hypothetical protein